MLQLPNNTLASPLLQNSRKFLNTSNPTPQKQNIAPPEQNQLLMVNSPITGSPATLVMKMPVQRIVDGYLRDYNMSVERHFDGLDEKKAFGS